MPTPTTPTAQELLDRGKYIITQSDGYWHMCLPPSDGITELLGDNIFRTGFEATVPEITVREFYAKQLEIDSSNIVNFTSESELQNNEDNSGNTDPDSVAV